MPPPRIRGVWKPGGSQPYRELLLQNHDPESREYADAADQTCEVLIHGNYLSQKDIEICRGFDLGPLTSGPDGTTIRELHDALVTSYGSDR